MTVHQLCIVSCFRQPAHRTITAANNKHDGTLIPDTKQSPKVCKATAKPELLAGQRTCMVGTNYVDTENNGQRQRWSEASSCRLQALLLNVWHSVPQISCLCNPASSRRVFARINSELKDWHMIWAAPGYLLIWRHDSPLVTQLL